MKKFLILFLSLLIVMTFAGCGSNETSTDKAKDENEAVQEQQAGTKEEANLEAEPVEVPEGALCDSCNMTVYPKDHEMGVFSAQGVTQDGKNVFFDDIGCILNYERKNGEALKKEWVRDHDTLAWTEIDDAFLVKTDLKSPMKWGYVFFDSEEKANTFIENNKDVNPALADWEQLDQLAKERFEKMMQAQKEKSDSKEMEMNMKESGNDHNH